MKSKWHYDYVNGKPCLTSISGNSIKIKPLPKWKLPLATLKVFLHHYKIIRKHNNIFASAFYASKFASFLWKFRFLK